jgi:hypothetical protein
LKGVSELKAENKFLANEIETMPDQTGEKQVATRFKPGQSGNPAGRPKGARSRLGEKFLDALHDEFEKSGPRALAICAAREPTQFLKIVAGILPRELLVKALSVSANVDFTLDEARQFLGAYRTLRDAPQLEHRIEEGSLVSRVLDDD